MKTKVALLVSGLFAQSEARGYKLRIRSNFSRGYLLIMKANVNYLAVVVAALAAMGIRFYWYAPGMFRESWMKIIGMDKLDQSEVDHLRKEARSHPTFMFIATFFSAAVMSRFIDWVGASGVGAGIIVGFWAWLGFALPVTVSDILFSGRESGHMWKLFLIQGSLHFFALLVMGGILGAWT